jgi:AraC-like DNA-binding protein
MRSASTADASSPASTPHIAMPQGSLVCETYDLTEATDRIAKIFCAYDCEMSPAKQRNAIVVHSAEGNRMRVSSCSYGSAISLYPERFEKFVVISTTVAGKARVDYAGQSWSGEAGTTSVISPDQPARIWYGEGNTQLSLRIETADLVQLCGQVFGVDVSGSFDFALGMAREATLARWYSLVTYYCQLLDEHTPSVTRDLLLKRAEEMIMITLLTEHEWNGRFRLSEQRTVAVPAQIRRAIEFIQGNVEHEVCLTDIADAAGCSARSLQRGFLSFCNNTPMGYLKQVRLKRARELLLRLDERENVTSIAFLLGFTHLSQFSADYKRAFGESPSETIRRRS